MRRDKGLASTGLPNWFAPGRKVEDCGRESINAEVDVSFDQSYGPVRFLAENESGNRDGIAADVQYSAAADFHFVTNVLRVRIEIAEETIDSAKLPNTP